MFLQERIGPVDHGRIIAKEEAADAGDHGAEGDEADLDGRVPAKLSEVWSCMQQFPSPYLHEQFEAGSIWQPGMSVRGRVASPSAVTSRAFSRAW